MIKLAFIAAFVFAASPAAAQLATQNGQAQGAAQGTTQNGQAPLSSEGPVTAPTQAPTTGVFCIEEMTATFCNVVTGPNTGGYGARTGSTSTNGSATTTGAGGGAPASIPPCPAEPPFDELCN